MISLYDDCLKPKFSALDSTTNQLASITAMTDALNEWLMIYFSKVYCNIYGTVTYPSGATAVLGTPATPLKICRPIFESFMLLVPEVIAAVSVPAGGLVNLFNYIGIKITGQIVTWTAAPIIPGIATGAMVTSHFSIIAEDMMLELQQINPDPEVTPDATKEVWNIIEKRLDSAIKMCVTTPVPYVGAFGPGVFNGIAEINLNPEGI